MTEWNVYEGKPTVSLNYLLGSKDFGQDVLSVGVLKNKKEKSVSYLVHMIITENEGSRSLQPSLQLHILPILLYFSTHLVRVNDFVLCRDVSKLMTGRR